MPRESIVLKCFGTTVGVRLANIEPLSSTITRLRQRASPAKDTESCDTWIDFTLEDAGDTLVAQFQWRQEEGSTFSTSCRTSLRDGSSRLIRKDNVVIEQAFLGFPLPKGDAKGVALSVNMAVAYAAATALFSGQYFLLHASAVTTPNGAVAFFGPSGVGKSTICTLDPPGLVLADTFALIGKHGDGYIVADGGPLLYANAQSSIFQAIAGVALSRVYALNQGSAHRIEALPKASSLRELWSNTRPHQVLGLTNQERAALLIDFVDTVPCQRLHFSRSPSVWDAITADETKTH